MAPHNSIKHIPGYENRYGVTDDGRVYSFLRHRYIKPYINSSKRWGKHDRPLVKLSKNGKSKVYFVSRLVYTTFKGPIPKGHDLDHINGDKLDNRLINLRPLTRSENMLSYFALNPIDKRRAMYNYSEESIEINTP